MEQKKISPFPSMKKLVVFSGTRNQNVEIFMEKSTSIGRRFKTQLGCHPEGWGKGGVEIRDGCSTGIPFNRHSKKPRFWTGRVARFFLGGKRIFGNTEKLNHWKTHWKQINCAFLGINVIDMYIYIHMSQVLLKFRVSLECLYKFAWTNRGAGAWKMSMVRLGQKHFPWKWKRSKVVWWCHKMTASKRTSGCLRKFNKFDQKENQLQKDVKILPSPNMWNIVSTRMTWHICWSDRLQADHPQAWQWSPALPHVAHAAVHGTEAVRSAVLEVQDLAILTQQPRITTLSDHYLVHPDKGGFRP